MQILRRDGLVSKNKELPAKKGVDLFWLKVGCLTRHIRNIMLIFYSLILLSVSACTSFTQKEINNLHSGDVSVRVNTVKAIGETHDAGVVETLRQALKDKDPYVRKTAVETLASIGDQHAIESLLPVLADSNDGVRKCALLALEKLGAGKTAKIYILKNNLVGNFWGMNQYTVGHKSGAEPMLLAQIIKTMINEYNDPKLENAIFAATREFNNDAEVQRALEKLDIHIGIEYSGTAFSEILGQQGETDPQKIYEFVRNDYYKKYKLIYLNPFGCTASKKSPDEPDSYASAVVRWNLLQSDPSLGWMIKKLAGKIDNETMAGLIEQVNKGGKPVQQVIEEFLQDKVYSQEN